MVRLFWIIICPSMFNFTNFLSTGTTDSQDRGEYFGITGSAGSNIHNYSLSYSHSTLSVITNAVRLQYQLPRFHVTLCFHTRIPKPKILTTGISPFSKVQQVWVVLLNQNNLDPMDIVKAANNDLSSAYLNGAANTSSFSRARALSASLDLDANLNLSENITSVIKFGGMYRYQTRSYSYSTTGSQGLGLQSARYVDSLITTFSFTISLR